MFIYAHQSFHFKPYILIVGKMIDLCSAITTFMEFVVILGNMPTSSGRKQ